VKPLLFLSATLVLLGAICACGGDTTSRDGARRIANEAAEALREGDLERAAELARTAGDAEDADVRALAAFVRGNLAFARAQAEAATLAPESTPRDRARAIALAEDALGAWQAAAASRRDWPEARRNVERALLLLARLRERKRRPGGEGGAGDGAPPRPPPPAPPPEAPAPRPPVPEGAQVEAGDLPAGQVLRLLEVVRAKEAERRAAERAERRRLGGRVERDW
jgi:hypothetical protein